MRWSRSSGISMFRMRWVTRKSTFQNTLECSSVSTFRIRIRSGHSSDLTFQNTLVPHQNSYISESDHVWINPSGSISHFRSHVGSSRGLTFQNALSHSHQVSISDAVESHRDSPFQKRLGSLIQSLYWNFVHQLLKCVESLLF
ncbi:hypothetical protein AVEN_244316-1 [Araneus ventricosus]|uniref:Uncharacterized protein n=1 Tax=Araneus ventricosus TaxID=182803 RepID=A0A4Y2WDF2_ARAVE|nr:hypothetical protein AVEN_244316-1 [Araneus ventricosus]